MIPGFTLRIPLWIFHLLQRYLSHIYEEQIAPCHTGFYGHTLATCCWHGHAGKKWTAITFVVCPGISFLQVISWADWTNCSLLNMVYLAHMYVTWHFFAGVPAHCETHYSWLMNKSSFHECVCARTHTLLDIYVGGGQQTTSSASCFRNAIDIILIQGLFLACTSCIWLPWLPSEPQESTCRFLTSMGMTSMHHHTWKFLIKSNQTQFLYFQSRNFTYSMISLARSPLWPLLL